MTALMIASLLSIFFALIAAGLWALSAVVNLPVIGSAYGSIANLEPFYAAMKKKKVARLNAGAATCSFSSAAAQAVALYYSR